MPDRSFQKFVARLEEIGLREQIEKRTQAHHVSLRALYDGPREPSTIAARRAVYSWLIRVKKRGSNEVARLFDRSHASVSKMVRGEA
jgi:hypothetical protein